jgi:hypothetical protein
MQRSFREVFEIPLSEKISMRKGALVLGIGRVAEATRLRGIYPQTNTLRDKWVWRNELFQLESSIPLDHLS